MKSALDEKEKQVASMLQEREMDRDEIVKLSAAVLGKYYYFFLSNAHVLFINLL